MDYADAAGQPDLADLGAPVEGPEEARLELRRPDHRLRLHAGHGPGQRPYRRLFLPAGRWSG